MISIFFDPPDLHTVSSARLGADDNLSLSMTAPPNVNSLMKIHRGWCMHTFHYWFSCECDKDCWVGSLEINLLI